MRAAAGDPQGTHWSLGAPATEDGTPTGTVYPEWAARTVALPSGPPLNASTYSYEEEDWQNGSGSPGGFISSFFNNLFSPCGGGSAGRTEARLQALLSDFALVIRNGVEEARVAPEARRGAVLGAALKKARRLDREVAALLTSLPQGAANGALLAVKYQQLHEDARALEASARPYEKEPPKTSLLSRLGVAPPPDGRALALRLDDLEASLDRLDEALRGRGGVPTASELGRGTPLLPLPGGQMRVEQVACDRASAEYETLRVSLPEGQGSDLLASLRGFTRKWHDPRQVQALLRRRNEYLVRYRFEPARLLLARGTLPPSPTDLASRFLQHNGAWQETLRASLGPLGSLDWRRRALDLLHGKGRGFFGGVDGGILHIRRIRAYELRKADIWDDSDPYVLFTLGSQEGRTGVVWNQANPEWRHLDRTDDGDGAWQEVSFEIPSLSQAPPLQITVKDYDRFSADDVLGIVEGGIPLAEVLQGRLPPPLAFGPQGPTSPRPAPSLGAGVPLPLAAAAAAAAGGPAVLGTANVLPGRGHSEEQLATHGHGEVHVEDGGAVFCRFRLKDEKRQLAQGDPTIEFELFWESRVGDPLVLQPEANDEALALVGKVDTLMASQQKAFDAATLGFFLGSQGPSPYSAAEIPREVCNEVWEYNRLLDRLALLTTNPSLLAAQRDIKSVHDVPDLEALAGVLSEERLKSHSVLKNPAGYFASREEAIAQFRSTLEAIQAVETRVKDDQLVWAAYAFQAELLPHVGEWGYHRREVLRNQVFLAQRHFEAASCMGCEVCCGDMWAAMTFAGCLCLVVYGVAMCALVWGAGWEHRGLIMVAASLMVLGGLVLAFVFGSKQLWTGEDDIMKDPSGSWPYARINTVAT